MLCKHARQHIDQMLRPDTATADLRGHFAQCDSCREFFQERRFLQNALLLLRSETAHFGPSLSTEQQVLSALNRHALLPNAIWNTGRWYVVGALAVVVLVFAVIITPPLRNPIALAPDVADEQFTAMPYVIPPAPYERTEVIRTEIPLQIVLSAGFQVQGEGLGSSTLADVVYGEDGRILALRLVSQPGDFSTTRMD